MAAAPDLQAEFTRRIRRHLLLFPLLVVAVGVPALAFFLLKTSMYPSQRPPPSFAWTAIAVFGLGVGVTIAYGIYSAFRNLRCPACDRAVWGLVSWNSSFFGVASPRTKCPACQAEIVAPDMPRRASRVLLAAVVIGACLVLVGVLAGVLLR